MRKNIGFQIGQDAVEALAKAHGTPLLILSSKQIEKNYQCLRKYLPRVRIFYAIKANPHPEILKPMIRMGASFDVASDGEIRLLNEIGVAGERLIYANPVKTGGGLKACRECGVGKMTFDSVTEIYKIKETCPESAILLRLCVDNSSAHVDLNKKFGVSPENALKLMLKAKEEGLDVAGIAFHVGSQTTSADPYLHALDLTRKIFEEAEETGLKLRILDIGGGFPIPEPSMNFNFPEMLRQINARLDEDFAGVEIWAEPGRYICGTSVNLITSVIGVTERGGQPWYFLDEGLYGTFSGVLFDQWDFRLISFKNTKERVSATFCGPSCDSLDIMFRGRITAPLEVNDILLVPACGAYTSASATTFNGFGKAEFVVWEQAKKELLPAWVIDSLTALAVNPTAMILFFGALI
ncbi:MAG: type III PLP-dependent enzyme [Phascolarctobacterium sp.]|nr:type III PLP-dependent enzyme [Phascolarctobacterium sp.]